MYTSLLEAMLRAYSEAQAGKPWTDEQWAQIYDDLRPDDERVVAMRAIRAVVVKRVEWVTEAVTHAAIERKLDEVLSVEPLDAEALREATVAVHNRFAGGSSGLDDMAEAVAADHAEAAVRAYLTAVGQRIQVKAPDLPTARKSGGLDALKKTVEDLKKIAREKRLREKAEARLLAAVAAERDKARRAAGGGEDRERVAPDDRRPD